MKSMQDPESRIKKKYPPDVAFEKICSYCAYQERSHKEVRNKLYEYGLYKTDVENLLTRLITDGFLNEERFAKAFAGGKFRMKKWGKNKIVNELESHGVTSRCIEKGLKEIDGAQYAKTLGDLIKKKYSQTISEDSFKRKHKTARFVIGKGYEPDLVWAILKEMDE